MESPEPARAALVFKLCLRNTVYMDAEMCGVAFSFFSQGVFRKYPQSSQIPEPQLISEVSYLVPP